MTKRQCSGLHCEGMMGSFERFTDKSIGQYQCFLDYLQQVLSEIVSLKPEEILDCCKKLQDMQGDTQRIDSELLSVMENCDRSQIDNSPAFSRRLALMRKVQEQNNVLCSKIIGMQTVVAAELSQAKGGMVAMGGYKSDPRRSGTLLSKSC